MSEHTVDIGCPCTCHLGGPYATCSVRGGCADDHHGGCHVCTAPTGDDAHLCRTHTDHLTSDLANIPELLDDLAVTVTRQDRVAHTRHGGRSATTPLPWNEHAAAKTFELNATLNAWALDVDRMGRTDLRDPLAPIHHSDTAAVAAWLLRNLANLRRHPQAGQAHEEITDSVRQARRATDRPDDLACYGPCGAELPDHTECPAYLYRAPGKPTVTCPGCGTVHDTAARMQWMRDYARDMLGTATEVAGYLKLTGITTSPAAVRNLADRGRIVSVALDARARPLYRIEDVVTAISERYKRRKAA